MYLAKPSTLTHKNMTQNITLQLEFYLVSWHERRRQEMCVCYSWLGQQQCVLVLNKYHWPSIPHSAPTSQHALPLSRQTWPDSREEGLQGTDWHIYLRVIRTIGLNSATCNLYQQLNYKYQYWYKIFKLLISRHIGWLQCVYSNTKKCTQGLSAVFTKPIRIKSQLHIGHVVNVIGQ